MNELEEGFEAFPGTVSVWFGPLSGPAWYTRAENVRHYAASTMKVGVMAAAFRTIQNLDFPVPVHNAHKSAAPSGSPFGNEQGEDGDPEVWQHLGSEMPLRWLITRMIVRSSNLATNLVLARIGVDSVNEVWRDAGALKSHTDRGIEDAEAREAGLTNEVTAADLSNLMRALVNGSLAGPRSTREMTEILCSQEYLDDFTLGLPGGVRMAAKNGWVTGVRHCTAVIYPDDSQPYVLSVCTTGETSDRDACALLGRVAKASWENRK